jgi:hypothetical protein
LNRLLTARPGLWWERLSHISVVPFHQDWAGQCSFCGIVLLSQEPDGWCCNKGRRRRSPLRHEPSRE